MLSISLLKHVCQRTIQASGRGRKREGGAKIHVLNAYSLNHGLEELASVASASSMGFGSQVHEIIGVVVSLSQDFYFGVVKQR